MGIRDLHRLIEQYAPDALQWVYADTIGAHKRWCIDVNLFLYRFKAAKPHYEGRHVDRLVQFVLWLRELGVEPILVFDGKSPVEKAPELDQRKRQKQKSVSEARLLKEALWIVEELERRCQQLDTIFQPIVTVLPPTAAQSTAQQHNERDQPNELVSALFHLFCDTMEWCVEFMLPTALLQSMFDGIPAFSTRDPAQLVSLVLALAQMRLCLRTPYLVEFDWCHGVAEDDGGAGHVPADNESLLHRRDHDDDEDGDIVVLPMAPSNATSLPSSSSNSATLTQCDHWCERILVALLHALSRPPPPTTKTTNTMPDATAARASPPCVLCFHCSASVALRLERHLEAHRTSLVESWLHPERYPFLLVVVVDGRFVAPSPERVRERTDAWDESMQTSKRWKYALAATAASATANNDPPPTTTSSSSNAAGSADDSWSASCSMSSADDSAVAVSVPTAAAVPGTVAENHPAVGGGGGCSTFAWIASGCGPRLWSELMPAPVSSSSPVTSSRWWDGADKEDAAATDGETSDENTEKGADKVDLQDNDGDAYALRVLGAERYQRGGIIGTSPGMTHVAPCHLYTCYAALLMNAPPPLPVQIPSWSTEHTAALTTAAAAVVPAGLAAPNQRRHHRQADTLFSVAGKSAVLDVETCRAALQRQLKMVQPHTTRITGEDLEVCYTTMRTLGVAIVHAEHEAEATCARLVRSGIADWVVTDDFDALPFGAPVMLRKLNHRCSTAATGAAAANGSAAGGVLQIADADAVDERERRRPLGQLIHLQKVLDALHLSVEKFVQTCILCKCDFCPSLPSIPYEEALRLVRTHDSLLVYLRDHWRVSSIALEEVERAQTLFLSNYVSYLPPCVAEQPDVRRLTPLRYTVPVAFPSSLAATARRTDASSRRNNHGNANANANAPRVSASSSATTPTPPTPPTPPVGSRPPGLPDPSPSARSPLQPPPRPDAIHEYSHPLVCRRNPTTGVPTGPSSPVHARSTGGPSATMRGSSRATSVASWRRPA